MKITNTTNNKSILKELGSRIKDTRIQLGLKQADMAVKAGVSPATMQRIENGACNSIDSILNVLRSLNLLENINLLIPEYEIPLEDIVKKAKKKKRVRNKEEQQSEEWVWGEDKK